mmetsp:Transcript_11344/g.27532  ORF Transcript_11344/g.27532 Transcript_11344/m.27532 type:complete len:337 (-) Transcript_11344:895-1905(-)
MSFSLESSADDKSRSSTSFCSRPCLHLRSSFSVSASAPSSPSSSSPSGSEWTSSSSSPSSPSAAARTASRFARMSPRRCGEFESFASATAGDMEKRWRASFCTRSVWFCLASASILLFLAEKIVWSFSRSASRWARLTTDPASLSRSSTTSLACSSKTEVASAWPSGGQGVPSASSSRCLYESRCISTACILRAASSSEEMTALSAVSSLSSSFIESRRLFFSSARRVSTVPCSEWSAADGRVLERSLRGIPACLSAASRSIRMRSTCSRRELTRASWGSRLTTGLFLMFRARFAYVSALKLSAKLMSAGETHAIISVFELPPIESWRRRVSLESR